MHKSENSRDARLKMERQNIEDAMASIPSNMDDYMRELEKKRTKSVLDLESNSFAVMSSIKDS